MLSGTEEIFSCSSVAGSPSKIPFRVLKRVVEISPFRNIITWCLFHGWLALTLNARIEKGISEVVFDHCVYETVPCAAKFRKQKLDEFIKYFHLFFWSFFQTDWRNEGSSLSYLSFQLLDKMQYTAASLRWL